MELYTNSIPPLITDNVTAKLNSMVVEISNGGKSVMQKIFDDFVYPNLTIIIVIILIVLFLVYCYYSEKESKEEKYIDTKKQLGRAETLFDNIDDPNEKFIRPVFNPSQTIQSQESYTQYLPDDIPILIDGKIVRVNENRDYRPPPTRVPNPIQYQGPEYAYGRRGVSDDQNMGFVDASEQNLFDFDSLLENKIDVIQN